MSRRNPIVLLFWTIILFTIVTPAFAQGNIIFRDEVGDLDQERIERAAQPLVDRGAQVGIYLLNSGTESDVIPILEQDGLADGQDIGFDTIAIVVSLDDRYSEIAYGGRWVDELEAGRRVDAIREDQLNAGLQAGDFTAGFVDALEAVDQTIASPPPASGVGTGGATAAPIGAGTVAWCAGILAFLVGGPAVWFGLSKRRKASQALATAQQRYENARREAGNAIADLAKVVSDARDKAAYDTFSYPETEVAQLAALQQEADAQFVKAQKLFDQVGETLAAQSKPTEADYQKGVDSYAQVIQLANEVEAPLDKAQERRAELDKLNAAAPGEVNRAKKALADVVEQIDALQSDFNAEAVTRHVAEQTTRAETLLNEHRSGDAIEAAQTASANISNLMQILSRYADIREGISVGRAGAENVTAEGYRIENGLQAFNTAEALLKETTTALEQQRLEAAQELLDRAEAARAEGVQLGGGLPALRRRNEERLAQLQQVGEELDAYIDEGERIFDIVDEFAESTWSDIRGNGSEAEAALADSYELWEEATAANDMETQAFSEAADIITDAEEQQAFVRTLIDTIIQRLRDLELARDTARIEIAEAQADINKGWEFIRSKDSDIGQDPEKQLAEAAQLIEQAEAEIRQEQPDWLQVVKRAQQANRFADAALAAAQGEVERMDKLRAQVDRAKQVATAEVQKIIQFVSVHKDDINSAHRQQLDSIQSHVQEAYAAVQTSEQAEEEARVEALRSALAHYTQLGEEAERLYNDMYAAFQRINDMRTKVEAEAQEAQQAIKDAKRNLAFYGNAIRHSSEGRRMLNEAHNLLQAVGTVHSEESMQQAITQIKRAYSLANDARRVFDREGREYAERPQRDDSFGDFMTGVLVGSSLDNDRHRRRSRSRSSWGGGSSSWGGSSSRRSSGRSGGSWSSSRRSSSRRSGGRSGGSRSSSRRSGGRSGGGW
ncbi:MAG: chromosome partitioning protein ParA [Chloroflexota bacterium]